jgi:hypothetical protein
MCVMSVMLRVEVHTAEPLEIGWSGMEWTCLAHDGDKGRPLVDAVMSLRVPQNAGNVLTGCRTGGLSSSDPFRRVSVTGRSLQLAP